MPCAPSAAPKAKAKGKAKARVALAPLSPAPPETPKGRKRKEESLLSADKKSPGGEPRMVPSKARRQEERLANGDKEALPSTAGSASAAGVAEAGSVGGAPMTFSFIPIPCRCPTASVIWGSLPFSNLSF